MKKIFRFSSHTDLSSKNLNFLKLKDYSIRNKIRDKFDKFLRRPYYNIIYCDFFKSQNYPINITLSSKGLSTLERRKILNEIKSIKKKVY